MDTLSVVDTSAGQFERAAHGFHRGGYLESELHVSVKNQIFVRRLEGECLAQLLRDPKSGRVARDIEVQDVSAVRVSDTN